MTDLETIRAAFAAAEKYMAKDPIAVQTLAPTSFYSYLSFDGTRILIMVPPAGDLALAQRPIRVLWETAPDDDLVRMANKLPALLSAYRKAVEQRRVCHEEAVASAKRVLEELEVQP